MDSGSLKQPEINLWVAAADASTAASPELTWKLLGKVKSGFSAQPAFGSNFARAFSNWWYGSLESPPNTHLVISRKLYVGKSRRPGKDETDHDIQVANDVWSRIRQRCGNTHWAEAYIRAVDELFYTDEEFSRPEYDCRQCPNFVACAIEGRVPPESEANNRAA